MNVFEFFNLGHLYTLYIKLLKSCLNAFWDRKSIGLWWVKKKKGQK